MSLFTRGRSQAEEIGRTFGRPRRQHPRLCTVGRSGNDLHYRGYDILDFAEQAEFEEVAYLLCTEAADPWTSLKNMSTAQKMRGLPQCPRPRWSGCRRRRTRWTCCAPGCRCWARSSRRRTTTARRARNASRRPADVAQGLDAAPTGTTTATTASASTPRPTMTPSAATSRLLHKKATQRGGGVAMYMSLILYAEHEFNASTFACRVVAGTGSDMYSAICAGIGALRGLKHGGANEFAFDVLSRYKNPDDAEADIVRRVQAKEIVIGFGHPVYTTGDPRNQVIKGVAKRYSRRRA